MDRQAASILAPYLARDEVLLWSGKPNRLHYALGGIGWRVGFAVAGLVVVLGACAAWWLGVVTIPEPLSHRLLLALLAIPLLAGMVRGLAFPVERYLEAPKVAYGLTERRAIVLVEDDHARLEEFPLSEMSRAHRHDITDALATIRFADDGDAVRRQRRSFVERRSRIFIAVADADALMAHLKRLERGRSARKTDAGI